MLVRSDSICWVVPDRVVVIGLFVSAFGAGKRWTLHEQSAVAV